MIRLATPQDVPAILDVFAAAKRFMRQNGNLLQWSGSYPDEQIIGQDIAAGECYVMEENGIHAVFTLLTAPDPTYTYIEGEWPHNDPYGTIHRIASDGTVHSVLQKAVDFALTFHKTLRCDTHKDNLPMQNALTRAGFVHCGIIYLADGDPREAYQLN